MILTIFATASDFSSEDPGGRLMSPIITPWSSLGTNPPGVVFMQNTSRATKQTITAGTIHRLLLKKVIVLRYLFLSTSNAALNPVKKRCIKFCLADPCSACGLRNKAHNAGLKVSAFTADIIIAEARVNPNCLKNTPELPLINDTGIYTAAITRVMATIVPPNSV